jgi:hypothetical protein
MWRRIVAVVVKVVTGGEENKTDLEALLGLTIKFNQKKGPAVQGTIVRVNEVPGRADAVQVVLDDPESHSYFVPAAMATKEYRDRVLERKRIRESEGEPIKLDPDIVPILIGVGLLAFEIAFVIIVGAKR